jgi:hypothetical protein
MTLPSLITSNNYNRSNNMDDDQKKELQNLRNLEMALKLHNILMTGNSDTLSVVFALLSITQGRLDIDTEDILNRYVVFNEKMRTGEVCSSLLLDQVKN